MLIAFRRTSRSALHFRQSGGKEMNDDQPGKSLEDIHNETIENMTMFGTEGIQSV
jgi:hypothetical protein